ncbi:MAG: hypothetical protein HQ521_14160 [Bacteroidetes bacterium]|nr:hypothetical protein [Bacteroidota bacterium]
MKNAKAILKILFGFIRNFNVLHFVRFFKINSQYAFYSKEFYSIQENLGLDILPVGEYAWDDWRDKLRKTFVGSIPIWFLHNKFIKVAMVYGGAKASAFHDKKVDLIENAFDKPQVRKILRESNIGLPLITNLKYFTSENTIHQAFHISSYFMSRNKNILSSKTIIEWGGGYGCMARIVKQYNQLCTYIVMDLPEFCIVQKIYLSAIFGPDNVHIVYNPDNILESKINLISSDLVIHFNKTIKADAFISNWALTESGKEYQQYVLSKNFFSADKILISCARDKNNYVVSNDDNPFNSIIPIDVLNGDNLYLFNEVDPIDWTHFFRFKV